MNDLGSSSLGMIFPRPFINVESPSAHFQSSLPQWKYQVTNLDGSTSVMVLAKPDQAPNVP